VRNSALNLAAQGAYAVVSLLAIRLLAQGLGPAGFGEYYTAFALVLVVQLVAEAGVGTVLTRRLAQAPARWRETAAEARSLFLVIALLSAAAFLVPAAVAWGQGDPATGQYWAAAGLTCAALQVQRYCTGVFAAFEVFAYENVARLLQGAALVIALAALPATFESAAAVLLLAGSNALAALFLAGGLQLRLGGFAQSCRRPRAREWLAESVPLGLGDVLRGLTWQLDTIILGLLQPAAVVAVYSVAYRPLGPINWVPLAVLTAVFPSFARLAGEPRALERAFAASLRLLWLASLPIAVFFCVFAEPIIRIVAGPEYLDAALPMRLVIWITALSFMSYPFRYLLAVLGRQRAYGALATMILVFHATALLLLVPWWGCLGACAASLLGQLAFTLTGLWLCNRFGVGGVEWGRMVRGLFAAGAFAAVLASTRDCAAWGAALAMLAGTALYAALCVVLGALRRDEVAHFWEAFLGNRATANHE
jgi:O-antigen/teichoic acid export membrane protein